MYILYYFRKSDHLIGIVAYVLSIGFFYLGDRVFRIGFKKWHYVLLIFMATAGILLSPVYFYWAPYDKVLHFTFPFLGCFLVYYMVDKLKIDFKTKVLFTFTIMITLLTFEEIVEFTLDYFFDLKLQGVYLGDRALFQNIPVDQLKLVYSRITDTMLDLILGVCGAFIFVLTKVLKGK